MGWAYRQNGRRFSFFKILTDKPTGKRTPRKPRWRWDDNIGLDLKGIRINTRTQDKDYWRVLVNAASNLRVP